MKIIRILIVGCLLSYGSVFSQETAKFLNFINQATLSIKKSDLDSSFILSKNALSEAFETKNHLSKSKAYDAIGKCFLLIPDNKQASIFFEKGLTEAVFTDNDTIKGFLNTNLGVVFKDTDAVKSLDYFKKAKFFFKKTNENPIDANQLFIDYQVSVTQSAGVSETKVNVVLVLSEIQKIENSSTKSNINFQDSRTVDLLLGLVIGILLLLVLSLLRNNKQRDQLNKELETSNKELLQAKNKAEKATQLKSQFVSSITHELRTPLYGVVGITDVILDEHKELANSPHINSLKFSATYLLSLVNDLLQINKIEERKVVLENSFFNLSDEITTIANSLQFIAIKNSNKVTIKISKDISEIVFGDKLRLSQVFMNLISNALKFTKNGQITISANLARLNETQQFVTFCIQDTGVGIANSDQEAIFEKFVQIERNEDDYQGTGLGLAIVKNLVEIFGGTIELESELGKGTTFYFTIPFEIQVEKVNSTSFEKFENSKNDKYHVLVVEDNKINQIVTRKILEKNNFRCTVIEDGYQAIEILEKNGIDIILMDINMPIINGYETTILLRSKGYKLPIVALTAFDKEEVSDKAFASGMNDVIIKPFDNQKLFQIISDMISQIK